jgi:hypothetical protein
MTAPQKVRFSIERASAFVKRQRLCLYSYAETKLDERSDRLGDLRCGDIIRRVAINLHAVMKLPLRYVSETDALAKPRLRNQRHTHSNTSGPELMLRPVFPIPDQYSGIETRPECTSVNDRADVLATQNGGEPSGVR